jgi:5'-nucleotidase
MRILITNDDGIYAPGILALRRELLPLGEVTVIAPERPRSASGHSITLHKPLRIDHVALPGGGEGYASNGTPSDCVTLGLDVLLGGKADLVLSGINQGANLGFDLTYSGTVSAAMEGAILGLPSIAISVAGNNPSDEFGAAARFARRLVEAVAAKGMDRWTLLNVNVPALPEDRIRGVRITRQGRTQYTDRFDARTDPWGKPYYWFCGTLDEEGSDAGSDLHAISEGWVSVTPIRLDMTAEGMLDRMRTWGLSL